MCLEGLVPPEDLGFGDAAMAQAPGPGPGPGPDDGLGLGIDINFDDMTSYETSSLVYTRRGYQLQIITTVTALVTSAAAIVSLFWWWTQHYLLYRRNHIHHRHVAREEARAARYRNRLRSIANNTGTDVREPSLSFREPTYRRGTGDLQRELETIVNEARARQERLRVAFTMQELEAAVEFQQETAPAA